MAVGVSYLEGLSFRLQVERPAFVRLDLHLEAGVNLGTRAQGVGL